MAALNLNTLLESSFQKNKYDSQKDGVILETTSKLNIDLDNIVNGKKVEKTDTKLGIQLESIQYNTDTLDKFDEKVLKDLASAFAIDRVVEEIIAENISSMTNIEEARGVLKYVVRKGEVKQKLFCPEGFKAEQGKCVRMLSSEIIKRSRTAKLASKKRAINFARNRIGSERSRLKSDKIRERKSALMRKQVPAG